MHVGRWRGLPENTLISGKALPLAAALTWHEGCPEETFMKNRMWAKGETRKMWICNSWGSHHIFCNMFWYWDLGCYILIFGANGFQFSAISNVANSVFLDPEANCNCANCAVLKDLSTNPVPHFSKSTAGATVTVLAVHFLKIWAPIRCRASQKALLAPRFRELPNTKVCFPSCAAKVVYHGFT